MSVSFFLFIKSTVFQPIEEEITYMDSHRLSWMILDFKYYLYYNK